MMHTCMQWCGDSHAHALRHVHCVVLQSIATVSNSSGMGSACHKHIESGASPPLQSTLQVHSHSSLHDTSSGGHGSLWPLCGVCKQVLDVPAVPYMHVNCILIWVMLVVLSSRDSGSSRHSSASKQAKDKVAEVEQDAAEEEDANCQQL